MSRIYYIMFIKVQKTFSNYIDFMLQLFKILYNFLRVLVSRVQGLAQNLKFGWLINICGLNTWLYTPIYRLLYIEYYVLGSEASFIVYCGSIYEE